MSAGPTIADRLRRRVLVMSPDATLAERVAEVLGGEWEVERVDTIDALEEWHELLLRRFMVLDLEAGGAYDPLDVVERIRLEYQINLPIFCIGGEAGLRAEVIASRADRALEREAFFPLLESIKAQFA